MRILIACEFSGIVRDAFRNKGHDAWSCDIIESDRGQKYHYCQDVIPLLSEKWDMVIAFPPCTHIAVSGAAWFKEKTADGRQQQGIDFFMNFANCICDKVVIENPVGIMSTKWRKPDQIIQPHEFGDEFSKKTCLWLKGVPKLTPTKKVGRGEQIKYKSGKSMPKWYADAFKLKPKERTKVRSKTFPGIAKAMADTWG